MTGEGAGPTHRGPSLVSVFHRVFDSHRVLRPPPLRVVRRTPNRGWIL